MEILLATLLTIVGLGTGFGANVLLNKKKANHLLQEAEDYLEKSKKDIEKLRRETLNEVKEENEKLKKDLDRETREKRQDLKEAEDRLLQREQSIDKRDELYQNRERILDERESRLEKQKEDIQSEQVKVEEIKKEQEEILFKISKINRKEAEKRVFALVEEEMSEEISNYIKEQENEAKLTADKKANDLLIESMQRYAADVVNEKSVSVFNLPNDEMKGRIIGREGRNIRTIEAVTGVDLIIDDTPETVVLSSFDPLRREMARVMLETFMKDGRINPTRIEELYDKITKDMKATIIDAGQDAIFDLGLARMDSELVELIGKLKFRTSYGQNALKHSIEVANLAGLLAAEIGENVNMAKRAGLLHDIGKAIDHEMEGSHVEIGVDIAKRYGENEVVIDAIASHHGDVEPKFMISSLVAIADALSASRPGARNDSLENYIKRLTELEELGNQIPGVRKSFAVQAGRELRVLVKPKEVDDKASYKMAKDIKSKIEENLQYPGTIQVTVIREVRAIEEAK